MRLPVRLALSMCLLAASAACSEDEMDEPDRSATLSALTDVGVTGSLSLRDESAGITIRIKLEGCTDGEEYPVHIHQGTSCESSDAQGGHWGAEGVRGEGIPNVVCTGNTGDLTHTNTRPEADAIWTLDGSAETDPTGHAFVVHANDEPKTRIACGIIE